MAGMPCQQCGDLAPPAGPDPVRVLVIEANPYLRSLIRRELEMDDRFAAVGEVSDAASALARESACDVALIDVDLAGLTGEGVIAALHRREPSPVVVVLSTSGVPYLRYAATVEGADDFLVRPADLARIGDRLCQAAATRQASPPLPPELPASKDQGPHPGVV